MPITTNQTATIEYRLLPLTLTPDGGSVVYLRRGFTLDGVFTELDRQEMANTPAETQSVLQQMPTPGKNRIDDLAAAIYELAVSKGLAVGTIS